MTQILLDKINALPKVELHRHLEGAMRIHTLLEIAHKHDNEWADLSLDDLRPYVQMVPDQEFTADVFLSKFAVLRQFYNSSETIQRIAREVVEDAAADNIKYMELRFTPKALCSVLKCSYGQVMDWVCDTIATAATTHDIEVRLIVSMNRHEGAAVGREVLNVALAYKDKGVVAIDLAGQEEGFSSAPFAPIFQQAREAGLFTTAHAGEWSGAESVREVLEHLEVDRVGHGIRAVDDANVVQMLIDRETVLEVCPTSNLHSGVVPELEKHPLIELYRAGVKTTINTDDPLISNITLTEEMLDVMLIMRLTEQDIHQQILNAAGGAFLPAPERQALVARLQAAFS